MQATIAGKTVADWQASHPLLTLLMALRPLSWFNLALAPAAEALADVGLSRADVADADARLRRFAPYLARVFPDAAASGGIIESPLLPLPAMRAALWAEAGLADGGGLWLKADNLLPISGSIKARGGIYEVLKHAESLALSHGLLREGRLRRTGQRRGAGLLRRLPGGGGLYRQSGAVHRHHQRQAGLPGQRAYVGGRAAVEEGFAAQPWGRGGRVSVRLQRGGGRRPQTGGVRSALSFRRRREFGQSIPWLRGGGGRLRGQLVEQGVRVDAEHPLLVYLPCGVGGGPGGVAFGLKLAFGDAVHCLFAEPTHAPCMLLGVYTGLHDEVAVQDFGIDNLTAADGLAVGRPSGFVGRAMQRLIDGYYTVDDAELYRLLAMLEREQGLRLEPSALAGMPGPLRVLSETQGYRQRLGLSPERLARASHLVWGTGGGMVPPAEMDAYLAEGRRRLTE